MQKVKILIVEDELIIAEDIRIQLIKLGYEVTGTAISYNEALSCIMEEIPDLVLVDIGLEGNKDGIELGSFLKMDADIPFIYLTSSSEKATVARAKATQPNAYLLKPYKAESLYASIEIALSASPRVTDRAQDNNRDEDIEAKHYILKDSVFIKIENTYFKIRFADILYLKSHETALNLFTADGKKLEIESPMAHFNRLLNEPCFFQTHPSFIVNLNYLEEFNDSRLKIKHEEVPLLKSKREEFLAKLKALK